MTIIKSIRWKYLIVFFTLLLILSFKIIKSDAKKTSNCNCDKVVEAYTILNYRYQNKDTLIEPSTIWYDGTFDENVHIDVLKKVTALEINYTPITRGKKGFYLLTKSHLIHCENWIQQNCPKNWKKIDKYRSKYKNRPYTNYVKYKIDSTEVLKENNSR